MKRILHLILFSFGFFSSPAQTNIYHPFPESNAHWNFFSIQYYGCTIWQNYEEWLSIYISGDTVIANKNYHKLEIPYIQKNCLTGSAGHDTVYQGAFRQDTSLKQVFFVPQFDSTEQLLYDFTMEVGDTVKGLLVSNTWGCWTGDVTVISMDSVLVGGTYRKRWQLSYFFIEIIEGIGSTRGLIDPVCEIIDGPEINLNCFSHYETILYPSGATTCELIIGVDEAKAYEQNDFAIYPSPFNTTATLKIKNEKIIIKNCELKIYNTLGVLVRKEKILNLTSYTLHRESLNDGLYFYELQTLPNLQSTGQASNSELIGTGKFVIQ